MSLPLQNPVWNSFDFTSAGYSSPNDLDGATSLSISRHGSVDENVLNVPMQSIEPPKPSKYQFLTESDLASGEEVAATWRTYRAQATELNPTASPHENAMFSSTQSKMTTPSNWGMTISTAQHSDVQHQQPFTDHQLSDSFYETERNFPRTPFTSKQTSLSHETENFHPQHPFQASGIGWQTSSQVSSGYSPVSHGSFLPIEPEESNSRRDSDGTDSANEFNNLNIQISHSPQGLVNGLLNTPASEDSGIKHPTSLVASSVSTPCVSREISGNLDLASRRKRPRPAALVSGGQRSISYVGPLTASPGSRNSSLGASASVRRIKSTGNNLNVLNGRIQKPSHGSAQRSPLHFQSFEAAASAMESPQFSTQSHNSYVVSQSPDGFNHRSMPIAFSSPNVLPVSSAPYHQQPSPLSWNPGQDQFTPGAFDMHSTHSVPLTPPESVHTMPQAHQYHTEPPHSAPAHRTTFPNHSPQFSEAPFQQQYWPTPYMIPAGAYSNPSLLSMGQPCHNPMCNSGPSIPFYGHPEHAFMHCTPQMGHYQPVSASPSSPPKELEFHVTTLPEPQIRADRSPQPPRNFAFHNTTSTDFHDSTSR